MDFSLPDESMSFAEVVAAWARDSVAESPEAWKHGSALSDLGVFQLLGEEAVDPEHQHLNVSLVLEQLAHAGMIGPLAETIWAIAHAGADDIGQSGWVGAPVTLTRGEASLVPYGQHIDRVLRAATSPEVIDTGDLTRASVPMSDHAAWLPVGHGTTLEELDGTFAWMASASLTLGYCERLVDLALLQTRDRKAFGTDILTFQAPRFALVEAYQLIAGLRPVVRDVAWRMDRSSPQVHALSAAAWILAADVGRRVAAQVHQVMGAASFPDETGVTRLSGAMAVLRLGQDVDGAVETVWRTWRAVQPDRPSNIAGAFDPAPADELDRRPKESA